MIITMKLGNDTKLNEMIAHELLIITPESGTLHTYSIIRTLIAEIKAVKSSSATKKIEQEVAEGKLNLKFNSNVFFGILFINIPMNPV